MDERMRVLARQAGEGEGEALAPEPPKVPVGRVGFEDLSRARALLAEAKVPAMLALVDDFEASGEPLVVMSDHLAPLRALADRPGWALLDGSVAAAKRSDLEDRFQRGELRGLACSIRAAGVALTLTRASTMIFVDSAWNPAKNLQAEDRIYRIGQSRGVRIIRLVADHPIDRRVNEVCGAKEEQFRNTVDAASVGASAAPVAETAAGLAALASRAALAPVAAPVAPSGPRRWPNKVDARCERCGNRVAVGTGWSWRDDRGAWKSEHKDGDLACKVAERVGGRRLTATVAAAVDEGPRRPAASALESWATEGLVRLAALDPDCATKLNEVGFSKSDVARGHQLAALAGTTGLTEAGWKLAVSIARHYAGTQLGPAPEQGS